MVTVVFVITELAQNATNDLTFNVCERQFNAFDIDKNKDIPHNYKYCAVKEDHIKHFLIAIKNSKQF